MGGGLSDPPIKTPPVSRDKRAMNRREVVKTKNKKTNSRSHAKSHGGRADKKLSSSIHHLEQQVGWAVADEMRERYKIVTVETANRHLLRDYYSALSRYVDGMSKLDKVSKS